MQAFDPEEFRRNGHCMVDFIADTMLKIQRRQLPVRSTMQPGYLKCCLPHPPPLPPTPSITPPSPLSQAAG